MTHRESEIKKLRVTQRWFFNPALEKKLERAHKTPSYSSIILPDSNKKLLEMARCPKLVANWMVMLIFQCAKDCPSLFVPNCREAAARAYLKMLGRLVNAAREAEWYILR